MCGIAGIITKRGTVNTDLSLNKMTKNLAHRGPDDEGTKIFQEKNWEIGIGHRRLSIIDLTKNASQPMTSIRNLNTISYNGEIYNYHELKKEIESENFTWKSDSDTEVILESYNLWGIDSFQKLRGMFAFSIWDENKKELLLARDEFGIKPLYFYSKQNQFIFASEIRAFLESDLVPKVINKEGMESFLEFGSVSAPNTMINGVHSLMPGEFLRIKIGEDSLNIAKKRFSNKEITHQDSLAEQTYKGASEHLLQVLKDSVKSHLISDVPLGVFLSGGIDSSAIVALMHETSNKPINSFSVIFEQKKYSENFFAQQISKKFKTNHSEILLSENDILKMTPEALDSMDQPTMDGINTYVISKAVKNAGITVALSGLGADELFAGYSSFTRISKLNFLKSIPNLPKKILSKMAQLFVIKSTTKMKAIELLESDLSIHSLYNTSRQLFNFKDREALLPNIKSSDQLATIQKFNEEEYFDQINLMSELELQGYMTNTLLRDTDFMSMGNSLEVRVPFIDKEVYNYVSQLPGTWKIKGKKTKSILIDSLGDLIPEEIKTRKKMGFTLPFDHWLRTSLKKTVEEILLGDEQIQLKLGLTPSKISDIWKTYLSSPNDSFWSRPWALFVLIHWCEKNGVVCNN